MTALSSLKLIDFTKIKSYELIYYLNNFHSCLQQSGECGNPVFENEKERHLPFLIIIGY